MLSRSYNLSPQDCPEVPALLTLVLDEALKTLPLRHGAKSPSRAALSKETSFIDSSFLPPRRQRASHRLSQWVLNFFSGTTTHSVYWGRANRIRSLVRPRARHGTGNDPSHRCRFIARGIEASLVGSATGRWCIVPRHLDAKFRDDPFTLCRSSWRAGHPPRAIDLDLPNEPTGASTHAERRRCFN